MPETQQPLQQRRASLLLLFGAIIILLLVGALIYFASNYSKGTSNNPGYVSPTVTAPVSTTATPSPSVSASTTATAVPLTISSVDLSANPSSIDGVLCGSNLTVTYTATFHAPANNAGGTVDFAYTTTNGRGTTPTSITLNPGETSKTYTFTASGTATADHTFPGVAQVMVTSPNSVRSPSVQPTGTCH